MNELEKYQGAFKAALDVLNSARRMINEKSGCGYLADAITRDIVALENMVAPQPPEMEEVEVVRWAMYDRFGTFVCTVAELPEDGMPEGETAVKLTGTLKRPKPQPVERTVSVEARLNPQGGAVVEALADAAFRDHREAHGKKGILSFTWTEDPK